MQSSDRVPDSKTIRKFRQDLVQGSVIDAWFYRFNHALDDQASLPTKPYYNRFLHLFTGYCISCFSAKPDQWMFL
ncbi:MAG: hypothetical protein K9G39_09815 [Chlorobium sp.]|uniref:hypothetical protein n=1 Tax=Chlorobium sp. TaxID=1095 RepID=UPI00341A1C2C|nr:hypothetical protein [Chlorobium sp.]